MHAPGTTWHPFVPPFGYIKCAVCTCKVNIQQQKPHLLGFPLPNASFNLHQPPKRQRRHLEEGPDFTSRVTTPEFCAPSSGIFRRGAL